MDPTINTPPPQTQPQPLQPAVPQVPQPQPPVAPAPPHQNHTMLFAIIIIALIAGAIAAYLLLGTNSYTPSSKQPQAILPTATPLPTSAPTEQEVVESIDTADPTQDFQDLQADQEQL